MGSLVDKLRVPPVYSTYMLVRRKKRDTKWRPNATRADPSLLISQSCCNANLLASTGGQRRATRAGGIVVWPRDNSIASRPPPRDQASPLCVPSRGARIYCLYGLCRLDSVHIGTASRRTIHYPIILISHNGAIDASPFVIARRVTITVWRRLSEHRPPLMVIYTYIHEMGA